MLLNGKTAIVTGSNRGIGKAVIELFARQGCALYACARKPSDAFSAHLEALRAETGARIEPVYFDLADAEQVKAGIRQINAAKEPIHILVNNAGAIATAPFMMTSEVVMRSMFDVNFLAQISLAQVIARGMARQKSGSIINISSSAAIEGNEGRTAYAAAKGALLTATKVMARELGPANVRVNAVAPGLTQTDMMTGSTQAESINATIARTALRRVGDPAEIAAAILFLASDLSSYMTGQVLRVDGGM
jgi:3-oxoacyl-[acyl-carrier protein] reductase